MGTNEQYLAYLERELRNKQEALAKIEQSRQSGPVSLLYRIRSNGAGTFGYDAKKGKWTRTA